MSVFSTFVGLAAVFSTSVTSVTSVPPSYTISVSASPAASGSVTGGGKYAAKSVVTVVATPASGYSFVNWTENGSSVSTNQSYQFTVTSNRVLVGNFVAQPPAPPPAPPPAESAVQAIATGLNRPWNLTVDAVSAYWVENNLTGNVRAAPLSGGASITLATGSEPSAIAADNTYVYWIERNNGSGSLKKVPKGGGAVTTLATGLLNAQSYLALDAQFIYFGDGNAGGSGSIRKVPQAGGPMTTLVSDNQSLTSAVATDGAFVYYGDGRGNVKRVPVNGGAAAVLAPGSPTSLTVVSGTLYWVESSTRQIRKVPSGGGAPITIATASLNPAGIASDGVFVYWIELDPAGGVRKAPVSGGAVTTIGTEANTVGIVLDGANVYWAVSLSSNQGKIMKAAK